MPLPPFELLLLDAAGHALLRADGPSGKILAELPLPPGHAALGLTLGPQPGQTLLSLAGPGGAGALCLIDLIARTAQTLPLALPHPVHLAVAALGRAAYLADPGGGLYSVDLGAAAVAVWGKPAGAGSCVGLVAGREEICAVWEADGGGLAAAYAPTGALLRTCRLGCVPTGLAAGAGSLIIPFTAGPFSGEGLIVLSPDGEAPPAVIPIRCSRCAAHPVYPVHAALAPDGQTVYLACEGSAAVAVADLAAGAFTDAIAIGRSVSRLALTADGRFAVATSNANADLCLIDLVNRRPLAFTASRREILSPLVLM
jgi:DNA-binding beta-propeller fold protein YncE